MTSTIAVLYYVFGITPCTPDNKWDGQLLRPYKRQDKAVLVKERHMTERAWGYIVQVPVGAQRPPKLLQLQIPMNEL